MGNEDIEIVSQQDVFTLREGEWQISINGTVFPTVWNSKGAALAGLKTQAKRMGLHLLSKDCWCKPEVEAVSA